ncbi:Polyadenylate-binding protein [Pelomyxa schiedti]|nr:Polyadenylate-binding protein [Pelomyxa schiedti]
MSGAATGTTTTCTTTSTTTSSAASGEGDAAAPACTTGGINETQGVVDGGAAATMDGGGEGGTAGSGAGAGAEGGIPPPPAPPSQQGNYDDQQGQDNDPNNGEYNQSNEEMDSRSVFVNNVDFSATQQELMDHFKSCGNINRVTILSDKYSGHPKGMAYIEFADKESVATAIALTDSELKGRQIKVVQKRTNIPYHGGRGRYRRYMPSMPYPYMSPYGMPWYPMGPPPSRPRMHYRRASFYHPYM